MATVQELATMAKGQAIWELGMVTKVPAKGDLVPERATKGRVLAPETTVKVLAPATMV
jgi:hypothetical protein